MSFENLFASSSLKVVVPDTSVPYPPQTESEEWLEALDRDSVDRKQAFFDEQLHSYLTVRIEHPSTDSPADPEKPPDILLSLLAHIQITLEATYISSLPTPAPETPPTSRLSAPPRTSSLPKSSSLRVPTYHHPSIVPPETPNPTPLSAEHDRRYLTSEGTLLLASIWGQDASEDSGEAFSLFWSQPEQVWVAVYRLSLTVSFLRLNAPDPVLCLTVSATLREKPLRLTRPTHPLAAYFTSIGSQILNDPASPLSPNGPPGEQMIQQTFEGLEEGNLLEGLRAGPMFSDLYLPTTRLGTVSRQKLFYLPPVALPVLPAPSLSPLTAIRTSHPTLRKSYRKTLSTASGFRVRMRTVFVPYVLLPSEIAKSPGGWVAGSDERTVVLCVEIENSGEAGNDVGFLVEKVDVGVGGEGAKATLIGWGERCFEPEEEVVQAKTFPLKVSAMAQYNLLYAVSFLHAPEEVRGFSLATEGGVEKGMKAADLQRAVTISIVGKPYVVPLQVSKEGGDEVLSASLPTRSFSSRWNCILDLSPQQSMPPPIDDHRHQALPEPPSPFPASATPRTAAIVSSGATTPQFGTRRHTLPSPLPSARSARNLGFSSRALSLLNPLKRGREKEYHAPLPLPPSGSGLSPRMSYIPPSVAAHDPSMTTYSAPPPPPSSASTSTSIAGEKPHQPVGTTTNPPVTPAYPPFSATYAGGGGFPHSPMSVAAVDTGSIVGPSVEIRRERGLGIEGSPFPQTPGPTVGAGFGLQQPGASRGYGYQSETQQQHQQGGDGESEGDIIVSIGLLAAGNLGGEERKEEEGGREVVLGPGRIYPFEYFTLDIFVFNRSERVRRFEVTCPDRNWRRNGKESRVPDGGLVRKMMGYPGILPMDARVRIGPLLPSACQSVRMRFLAISPGVHSIDVLTLTDIESGFSMNLRAVMDVVVHEPGGH